MECSICLKIINEYELYKTTCNHVFHKDCIHKWLAIKKNCPYCRNNIIINIKDNTTILFTDHDRYYINYNGVIEIIDKSDIDMIHNQINGIMGLYEKIDIIICFIKNRYDVVDTIMDLYNFFNP